MNAYLLGAQAVAFQMDSTPAKRALVLRVNNIAQVVAKEGGSPGAFFQTVLPETIEIQFFKQMREQMIQQFADRGVSASVDIVEGSKAPATPAQGTASLYRDFALGVAASLTAVGLVSWWRNK